MIANIIKNVHTTRIFKYLFYICSIINFKYVVMNNKIVINPKRIIDYDFKHIFTYRLLFHIMLHYDNELKRVYLDKQDIADRYVVSYKTVCKCFDELKENNIIDNVKHYKNWYSFNNKSI